MPTDDEPIHNCVVMLQHVALQDAILEMDICWRATLIELFRDGWATQAPESTTSDQVKDDSSASERRSGEAR